MFKDATEEEVQLVLKNAVAAGRLYSKLSLKERKYLMHAIASGLENHSHDLVMTAMQETHLPEGRLKGEVARTVLQLRQYGDACARGDWMNIRIDTPGHGNVHTDLRKMQVPLGPVVVFGSSNFPFAYSTAGGDTACALAAGCPVIVKAHPAHAQTSEMVAQLIAKALRERDLPEHIFAHVHGASFDVGKWLVMHPDTRAVGFTGSLSGGRQLYDWAAEREIPIPVFSEMGSTNPVFLLSEKLSSGYEEIAVKLASSITTNAGQFCTKPGILVAMAGEELNRFISHLSDEIKKVAPQKMLHPGIASAYQKLSEDALKQHGVVLVAETSVEHELQEGQPYIATVAARDFISNAVLHQEVFGPYSLIVFGECHEEMRRVASSIDGKLTATLFGSEEEISRQPELINILREICGRFIINDVPTGVTVSRAMHHGGPYPATTDSRFTSVGADGIQRFTRPVCYQNWPDSLLPEELKDKNPLQLWRWVNGEWKNTEV